LSNKGGTILYPNTPQLVLGTAQWGFDYGIANRTGRPGDNTLREVLEIARARDVTWLDTAQGYGDSEQRIGYLDPQAGMRISTKLAPDWVYDIPDTADVQQRIDRLLASSCARLKRDSLDIVLLHRPEHRHARGGVIWRALESAKEDGRIAAYGISAPSPADAIEALEDGVEVIQVASSLLDQRLYRQGFFQRARERGVRIFVRSVFLQGLAFLAPEAIPAALFPVASVLTKVGNLPPGVEPWHLFLQWARSLPVEGVVIGAETAEQVRDLLDAWKRTELAERASLAAADVPDLPASILEPQRW
jgi:aryl-alcohol dehydrogenase-like predicted oxidoreductase